MQTPPAEGEVWFQRFERPPEPAEETLHWQVQIPLDHQITFQELSEAMHKVRLAGAPGDARVQLNGNQLLVWKRSQLT